MISILASKLYFFSLATAVFTIPFYRGATNIALLITLVSWLVAYAIPQPNGVLKVVGQNRVFIPVIGLYVVAVIGLFYSDHIQLGLQKLETLSPIIVFPFILCGVYYLPSSTRESVLSAYVFGIVLASLVCLGGATYLAISAGTLGYVNPVHKSMENVFLYHRLSAHLSLHAVYLALYLTFAIFILVERLFQSQRSLRERPWILILVIYLITILLLLQSANLTLAMVLFLVVLLVNKIYRLDDRHRRLKLLLGFVMIAMLVFAIYVVVNKIGNNLSVFEYDVTIHPPGNWNSANLRLALWEHALILIKDHWLIGVGTGSIGPYLVEIYKANDFYFAFIDEYHPHNQFLYSVAAWGVPGILVFLLMFYASFLTAWKRKEVLLFGLIWIFFQFSITESTLVISKGIVFFFFFLSFLIYSSTKKIALS